MSNRRYARRDTLVVKVANAVLHLASKQYRADAKAAIRYGLDSRLRDVTEGREPPGGNVYYTGTLFDSFTSDVAPAIRTMGADR